MSRLPPRSDESASADLAPDRFFQAALGHAADAGAAPPPALDELILQRADAAATNTAHAHAVAHLLRHLPDADEQPSPALDRRIVDAALPAAEGIAPSRRAEGLRGWRGRLNLSFGHLAALVGLAAGLAMLVLQLLRPSAADIDLPSTARAPEPPASTGLPAAPDRQPIAPPLADAVQPVQADPFAHTRERRPAHAAAVNRPASGAAAVVVIRNAPQARDEPSSEPPLTNRQVAEGLFPESDCEVLKQAGFKCMDFQPSRSFALPDDGPGADLSRLPAELRQQLAVIAEVLRSPAGSGKVIRIEARLATARQAAARAKAVKVFLLDAGVDPAMLVVTARSTVEGERPVIDIRRGEPR